MGTVCYKKSTANQVYESMKHKAYETGTTKGLVGRKCPRCYLMFETRKRTPKKYCGFCRPAMIEDERAREIYVNKMQYDEKYSLSEQWGRALEKHKLLSMYAENIAKAQNCTIVVKKPLIRFGPNPDDIETI